MIRISFHRNDYSVCCSITRRDRKTFYPLVTPASCCRLQRLINEHAEKFTVRPYCTATIGWVAESE